MEHRVYFFTVYIVYMVKYLECSLLLLLVHLAEAMRNPSLGSFYIVFSVTSTTVVVQYVLNAPSFICYIFYVIFEIFIIINIVSNY